MFSYMRKAARNQLTPPVRLVDGRVDPELKSQLRRPPGHRDTCQHIFRSENSSEASLQIRPFQSLGCGALPMSATCHRRAQRHSSTHQIKLDSGVLLCFPFRLFRLDSLALYPRW